MVGGGVVDFGLLVGMFTKEFQEIYEWKSN